MLKFVVAINSIALISKMRAIGGARATLGPPKYSKSIVKIELTGSN